MNKPKALIVEDNAINALVLKKAIASFFDPVHVVSDRETFQALEQETYGIIFMDINLGSHSQDGEVIMRQLKQDPRYADLPIVAVTSYALPGDRERFLEAGFDAYLPKPIRREQVWEEIQGRLSA
jgi:CheY-like chemotaxis protein